MSRSLGISEYLLISSSLIIQLIFWTPWQQGYEHTMASLYVKPLNQRLKLSASTQSMDIMITSEIYTYPDAILSLDLIPTSSIPIPRRHDISRKTSCWRYPPPAVPTLQTTSFLQSSWYNKPMSDAAEIQQLQLEWVKHHLSDNPPPTHIWVHQMLVRRISLCIEYSFFGMYQVSVMININLSVFSCSPVYVWELHHFLARNRSHLEAPMVSYDLDLRVHTV